MEIPSFGECKFFIILVYIRFANFFLPPTVQVVKEVQELLYLLFLLLSHYSDIFLFLF